jgi:hypothetical protein
VVSKGDSFEISDLSFHLVERMPKGEKPRMVALQPLKEETLVHEKVFFLQNGSRISSSGEIRYWVSNRGYNVDSEPIFTAEVLSLDSMVIPLIVAFVIPLFCFLLGLILGIMIAN